MKRPLWLIGTGVLLAIVVAFSFSTVIAMLISLACLLTALFFLVLRKDSLKIPVLFLLSFAIGLALGAQQVYKNIQPFEKYKGKGLEVEGFVEESSSSSERSARYTLWASFPNTNLPDSRIVIRDYSDQNIFAGERISCRIKFDDPKYASTKSYYAREGIPGEGVLAKLHEKTSTIAKDRLRVVIINLRERIYNKNNRVFSKETAALVNGMVFGITYDLKPELYHQMNRAGTSHLLSVSGLHLSIFSGFILWALGFIRLNEKAKNLLAMLAAVAFAFLTGLSAPMLRSLVMTLLFLFGRIIGRENDSINALGFSAIMIGVFKPFWVLSVGMWLSFLSTAGILVLGGKISKALQTRYSREKGKLYNKLVGFFAASFGITLGAYVFTLPLLVFVFGWVSLVSPFANLLAGPFSTVIVILGIGASALPVGLPFYPVIVFLVEFSSKMTTGISAFLAKIPFATFSFHQPIVLLGFIIILVGILVLWFKFGKKHLLAGIMAGVLVLTSVQLIANLTDNNRLKVAVLESNHTLLIRNQSAVIFGNIDTYNVESLIKYLDYQNVKNIDALVMIDHPDQINSGIYRLEESYSMSAIVGPDDAYVLELLAQGFPGKRVYSSGYATLELLGGVIVESGNENKIEITVGEQKVLLIKDNYDIINANDSKTIYITEEGELIKPECIKDSGDILGKLIYDREEILLPIPKGG